MKHHNPTAAVYHCSLRTIHTRVQVFCKQLFTKRSNRLQSTQCKADQALSRRRRRRISRLITRHCSPLPCLRTLLAQMLPSTHCTNVRLCSEQSAGVDCTRIIPLQTLPPYSTLPYFSSQSVVTSEHTQSTGSRYKHNPDALLDKVENNKVSAYWCNLYLLILNQ